MRDWKMTALAAVTAILVMGPAQAIAADVISGQPGSCTVVTVNSPYIYPAPNWEPFFRHHLYRYALAPTCVPIVGSAALPQPVISVRY